MTENEIIGNCKEGDIQAYKLIYERYEQPLLHTACRMLGHQQDAEDAVQMTFLKLYRSIKKFRYQSKFSTYLFRILMNTCFDQLDKKKKMRTQTLEGVNPSCRPKHDLRLQLEEAISSLPDQQKACFVLYAVEEMKQDEISDVLGLSIGGVKSNIFHAKQKLRQLLSDNHRGGGQ